MPTPATFGTFNFNDGVNYFVLEKPFSMNAVSETFYKVARLEGVKRTGAITNERTIAIKVRVVGTTRSDLETRLNNLYSALAIQQQNLTLFSIDTRYWVADCIGAEAIEQSGNPIFVTLALTFVAQQPYATSTTQSLFNTGMLLLSGTSPFSFPTQTITGGGNVYSHPTIQIFHGNDVTTWSSLSLSQTTDGSTLTLTSSLPSSNGSYLLITADPLAQNGWTVLLNGTGSPLAFSGIFPVMEPGSTIWTMSVAASAAPHVRVQWTWYPRWL